MFNKESIMKYSIKKFTVGIVSVAVGSVIFLGTDADASNKVENATETKVLTTVEDSLNTNGTTNDITVNNTIDRSNLTSVKDEIEKKDSVLKEDVSKENVVDKNSALNVLDKRTTDSDNIKDLLTNIIQKNKEKIQTDDAEKEETPEIEKGTKIISRLTAEYAEAISKGYIGLEGGKYDSLLYKNPTLKPDEDDDNDGILNKDELYIYKKDGRTYLGYDVHPKLADTDGDGKIDGEDKDKLIWNITARDMALFMNLVYEKDELIKEILDPSKSVNSFKENKFKFMHNELSPYWTVKRTYHQDNGLDAVLFETKANYPFLKNNTIQVLAIQGTNINQTGDVKADAALVLGNESNQSIATKDLIKALKNDESITNLYITGHSLGGYLSLRATAQAEKDKFNAYKGTYTFNAPKIYAGLFNFWGGGEMQKESNLTDKLAEEGKVINYMTDNDNVILSFLRLKNLKSIGNSAGKHSSTSYFESRINNNQDFNFGKRQGVDGVGYIDPNLKKLQIISPEKGTLSATFLPVLKDNNPISVMVGDTLKEKEILGKVDISKLPVNIKLSILKNVELNTLGVKKAKVKVLYLDDNTTNEVDVPILVNEANKTELKSVINAAENLVNTIVELNDKTKKTVNSYVESKHVLAEKLEEAHNIVSSELSSQNLVSNITNELANLGLDLITKRGALELADFAKYDPKLTTTAPTLVKRGEKIELTGVIDKIDKTDLPEGTKYKVEDISNIGNVGKVNVSVKVIYPDKTIDKVNIPFDVYGEEKGEGTTQQELEEYSLDRVPTVSEKGESTTQRELEEYPLDKVPAVNGRIAEEKNSSQLSVLQNRSLDEGTDIVLTEDGIVVKFSNKSLTGLKLKVEKIYNNMLISNIKKKLGESISIRVLDLKIIKNNKVATLNDERTVRIKLLDSETNNVGVYYVKNGNLTKLSSKIIDRTIEFNINHFSLFALVEKSNDIFLNSDEKKHNQLNLNSNVKRTQLSIKKEKQNIIKNDEQFDKKEMMKRLPNTGLNSNFNLIPLVLIGLGAFLGKQLETLNKR
ncbi:Rib/alpha-like domain-containing protein [Gemella cuniculi]|uniref:Rib/alpha-like domain-containing protein n=1 Tax=Gemella cuniculi TaxID=150240 RepID=UPI000402735F|nr:Rib/alpha-like domain-containing protein [Gemella cuniculi]